jgi:hypothetical protein
MKAALPPSELRKPGRQFLWVDREERYIPLIYEGQAMPSPAHYAMAERLTKRLHDRRSGR